VKVREQPSFNAKVMFIVKKGVELEIIQRGVFYSSNTEWIKVSYNGRDGFTTMQSLVFSKTAYY
jgi:hypothetical protein